MSRRRTIAIFCITVACLLPFFAHGQSDYSKVEIQAVKLSDSIYMLEGAGGNMVVNFGADGVLLIDDQFAPLTDKIRSAIAELTNDPIRFVINTHWHGDHTGGNENLGKAGSVIVAHDNVRERMSTEQFLAAFDRKVPAAPGPALPILTFSEGVTLHLNGATIEVFHVARAHTDGDSAIRFAEANVLHTGDVFFNGGYPFIDVSSGGGINGVIAAVEQMLLQVDADTRIVPGHGSLAGRKDLAAYGQMLRGVRDAIALLARAGNSENEAIGSAPTAAWDESWASGGVPADLFIRTVYQSFESR